MPDTLLCLLIALPWAIVGSAAPIAYALGVRRGWADGSDSAFGPVAAGLVRIEVTSARLDDLAEPCSPGYGCESGCTRCEPVPYWPAP